MASRSLCIVAVLLSVTVSTITMADDKDRHFTLNVLPLMKNKCFGCHGNDLNDLRGDYNMLSRQSLIAGGESGDVAVVPGNAADSILYQAVKWDGYEMPPKETDRLTEEEAEQIRIWIDQGAVWPSKEVQREILKESWAEESNEDGRIWKTSGGTSEEWTYRRYQPDDLWAFSQLPSAQEIAPAGLSGSDAIDHFIDQRLNAAGLPTAKPAAPRNLIRRATLDLTGLPATTEEISDFVAESQKDADGAYLRLIDRLLASPRYGERWGRHWLDVTRYADTGGMSNDYERSNMWRYRDYVIRAFNEDKPYNEFIVEQLAGDELADLSVAERTGADQADVHATQRSADYTKQEAEWIVATGFLRLGPWDNAMVKTEEARQIYLDDVVNITGQTFLAQTLRCCKCHDHKFDPIPTRDYYRIYAAFSTTHMAERPVPFLPEENLKEAAAGKAHVQKMLDFAIAEKNKLVNKRETAARSWYQKNGLPYKDRNARQNLPDDQKPPRHVGLDHVEQGQLKVREQDEWIWKRRLERYQPMAQSVFNSDAYTMAWNGARKLRIQRKPKKSKPVVSHILTGGALTALGDRVFPGVLSAVALPVQPTAEDPYLVTNKTEGRRLQLAQWMAHPKNGLTTRAIVNRVWQYHFGIGLAANANNFGSKGERPSHPQLLDWLAADFVQHGWKIKRLHKTMMLSNAYRRSTVLDDSEKANTVDPDNRLLSHFPRRRLSAEELRDSLLAITGELQHCNGGLPVMPEINMEVALQPRMIQFSLAPAYQPSPTPDLRNRRTIYAYQVRGQADPFTELFNQPQPNESCELRESASVTPQVFTLLNSDVMADRSIALAQRLQKERPALPDQIGRGFQLMFGRSATSNERRHMVKYVKEMTEYHSTAKPAKPNYPTQITRSVVEEFSGKPFEYQEILPAFDDYTPDAKPSTVTAQTRALADFCLLLMNTNEFMYVE